MVVSIAMDEPPHRADWVQIGGIAAIFFIGILVIPLFIGLYYRCTLHATLGFVGSILILQPVAAAVGVALGIPPIPILLIMFSVGISAILVLFGICDLFAEKSVWLRNHLDKVDAIAKKSALFQKYGIVMIIPFIWVPGLGLYGCALLAWLFHWRNARGISIILAGWMLAIILVLTTSMSIAGVIL
jgi:uncharacterized membrane protein